MKRRMLMGGTALLTVLAVGLGIPLTASGAVGVWQADYYGEYRATSSLISGSGGVNCRGGDVCVEKVGDTAEVSWEIQTTPLMVSDGGSEHSLGTVIAVPKVLDDLTLETIALPKPFDVTPETSALEVQTELISEPVPIVKQTASLFEGVVQGDAQGAVAPSLNTPAQQWQVNLYPDDTQLYNPTYNPMSLSEYFPSFHARDISFEKVRSSGFVPDSQVKEVYEILDDSWDKVVLNFNENRYFYERYVPYWLDALKSGDTDDLSYSPLLALICTFTYDLYGRYDIFNLIDAMAAVEAEHPEVLEPVEPLLGKDFEMTGDGGYNYVRDWEDALLTEEDQNLIDPMYYADGILDVDEKGLKYPARAEHERLAEQYDQLAADYDEYRREFIEKGTDAIVVDNTDLYDYIYVPASEDAPGVSSFRLTGTVKVASEKTYLPVRVFSVPNPCQLETCAPLDKYEAFGMFGDLPDYSLTDAELNADIAQLQTDKAKGVNTTATFRATSAGTDGRLGTMQCAPTSEKYGVWNTLGVDEAQAPQHNVAQFYYYAHVFDYYPDRNNPDAKYFISGYDANEDGCDQSDVLVTICDEPEEPTTPPTEPTTPPTEPTTPPTEPVVDTPVVDDRPESVPVTTTDEAVADVVKTSTERSLPKTGLSIGGLSLAAILLIAGGMVAARRTRQDA